MKIAKKLLALLLCVGMLVAVIPATTHAAGGKANVVLKVEATEVNVGDTFTVTLSYTDMTVTSFAAGIRFDTELLECISISGAREKYPDRPYLLDIDEEWVRATSMSTVEEANGNGRVGFVAAFSDETDYMESILFTATFKAKAAGAVSITAYEKSDGADGFSADADVQTVTINGGEPEHTHTLKHVPAKAQTCVNFGNIEYWYCTDDACGKYYSDADATTEIDQADTGIAPDGTSHIPGEPVEHVLSQPNCVDPGLKQVIVCCSECGEELSKDIVEIPIPEDVAHTLKYYEKEDATCLDEGKIAHWECDLCGKYFSDAEGKNEIEYEDILISRLEHEDTNNDHICDNGCGAELSQCEDKTNDHKCDICGAELSQCEDKTNDHKCDVCGDKLTDCTDKAGDNDHNCDICGEADISDHTPGVPVEHVLREPNCVDPGEKQVIVYCSECGEKLFEDIVEIPIPEDVAHTLTYFEKQDATCLDAGKIAHWECDLCDKLFRDAEGKNEIEYEDILISRLEHEDTNNDHICDNGCGDKLSEHNYIESYGWYMDGQYYGKISICELNPDHVEYEPVTNITEIAGLLYAFDRENGKFLADYTGIYEAANGDLYYVENGIAVQNKGLVQDVDAEGHIHYYYFGCGVENCSAGDACQGEYKAQKSNRHYGLITNGYLVEGGYTTGDDGVIEHYENLQGIQEIDGVKYYLMDGVKVAYGLFKIGEDYYYARSSGALAIGEYWVSKTNGLMLEKAYTFDENGKMINPDVTDESKNGIVEENGGLYYYENGILTYAGLIEIDGSYYYVNSSAQVITGKTYWISKTNGLMMEKAYTFAEDGKMMDPAGPADPNKNGIVAENDGLYYYVNGNHYYAGLIEIDGSYYYVNSKGQVITGQTYWISKTNGLMLEKAYTFAEDGKMVDAVAADPTKNGIIAEEDGLYYYVNGVRNYAGLIELGGSYYYVNSNGQVITGKTYWITKTNGEMAEKAYTFAEDGKMIIE